MSSKFKVLGFALALVVALGFYGTIAKADVTGSFGVNLSFEPIPCQFVTDLFIDQPCEETVFVFDFETDLNINITISGLTMGIHSHAGVTGFEDIILTFATTLGALDITDTFVFAQPYAVAVGFPLFVRPDDTLFVKLLPTCLEDSPGSGSCQTLFVKKRVEASISLGGVTFSNLAMFEDVNFPNWCETFIEIVFGVCFPPTKGVDTPLTYNTQSQAFGFGDVITIEGQTPSGITVRGETGICAEQLTNAIKKHSWDFTVNSDCVSGAATEGVKPPLLFSFEKLFIEGIPLAAGLSLDIQVLCGSLDGSAEVGGFFQCNFGSDWTITGGPIFNVITVSANFEQILGPATFTDVRVIAAGGPLLLVIDFDPLTFTPTFVFAQANFTINPDTNPASLRLRARGRPGISFFDARLSITRAGLTFFADLDYDVNPVTKTFDFDDLTLGLEAEAGIVTVESSVVIADHGRLGIAPEESFLLAGNLSFTVNF